MARWSGAFLNQARASIHRIAVDLVDHIHLASHAGRDERHRRDARRGDGEVSGGVGSARGRVTAPNRPLAPHDTPPYPLHGQGSPRAPRQHIMNRSVPGLSTIEQCVRMVFACVSSCISVTPPATDSNSLRLTSRTSALYVVLVMISSIQAARTIRRWCGHTGATLSPLP